MIYITGDTHGDLQDLEKRLKALSLSKDDILVICGDFGFDWNNDSIMEWMKFRHDYTVLFCDGNHENFDVLEKLVQVPMFGDTVGRFCNNTFRLMTGHMYDIHGLRFFVFGGAASIDKDWRVDPEYVRMYGKLWWKQEVPSQEALDLAKRTLAENNWRFDFFLSHTCRSALKPALLGQSNLQFHDPTEDMIGELEDMILENGGSWRQSFFGHFHVDKDVEKHHCLFKQIMKVNTDGSVCPVSTVSAPAVPRSELREMENEIAELISKCESLLEKAGLRDSTKVREIYRALLSGEITEEEASGMLSELS